MEIQPLVIASEAWFQDYVKECANNAVLQNSWVPAVGDWMERIYTLNMEPVVSKQERVIEILCYKSTAQGWWHVGGSDGTSRIWNSQEEIVKGTCRWIPRFDQLIRPVFDYKGKPIFGDAMCFTGSIAEIHKQALTRYVNVVLTIHKYNSTKP